MFSWLAGHEEGPAAEWDITSRDDWCLFIRENDWCGQIKKQAAVLLWKDALIPPDKMIHWTGYRFQGGKFEGFNLRGSLGEHVTKV